MTTEQAKKILEECLEKLNHVYDNRNELIHNSEAFGGSLETAIVLVENCIDDLDITDEMPEN